MGVFRRRMNETLVTHKKLNYLIQYFSVLNILKKKKELYLFFYHFIHLVEG